MRTGRFSEAVTERSLERPFRPAGLSQGQTPVMACVCGQTGTGLLPGIGLLLGECAQRLFAAGADPASVSVQIAWPAQEPEDTLKKMVETAALFCSGTGIAPGCIGGCAVPGTEYPVISITMCADRPKREIFARPGDDLCIAGQIGLAGTSLLAAYGRRELGERFPATLTDRAAALYSEPSGTRQVRLAARTAAGCGAGLTGSGGQGGIFAALRELALAAGLGFDADLHKIPVRQETIEICEYYDINPYLLYTPGILLACVPDGGAFCGRLRGQGIAAARIGTMTAGKDRILRSGKETRWLEKRQQDALWALWENRERKPI